MQCSLFLLFIIFITIVYSNHSTYGHFMVIFRPHVSFILCSTTDEERKSSQLKLVNIDDVLHNKACMESSKFDVLSHELVFQESNPPKLIKINKTTDKMQIKNMNLIELNAVSSNSYHFRLMNGSYLGISRFSTSLILSTKPQINFTMIAFSNSPFVTHTHPHHMHPDRNAMMDIPPRIGQRVEMDNKLGVTMKHIVNNNKDNTYWIQFDDGSVASYSAVHIVRYPIGAAVDAYWPPDRLKLTNLADVMWPALITNYSNTSDSYTLRYDDGTLYPNVPSIYVAYPQRPCMDERKDCAVLAKTQECRLNPSYAMTQCRKSCRVCTDDDIDNANDETDNTRHTYFKIDLNHLDLQYTNANANANANIVLESNRLNEIGEKLMLYGNVSAAEQYFLRSSWFGNNEAKFNLAHVYTVKEEKRSDLAVLYLYLSALGGSLSSNLALGYRHLYGYGVPKSCPVSAVYYQKAADTLFGYNGHNRYNPMQQQHIEMIRLYDVNRRDLPIKETDEVIRFYHTHADNGDANAQMALAQLYYYGLRGFEQDFLAAMNYFTLAAQQNHGDAYWMLGNIYVDGIAALGIGKNITLAMQYYQKAMDYKSVGGHTGMAFLYLEGVPDADNPEQLIKNTSAAFQHFKYAAKRQDLSAMFYLGLMYFNGIGLKQKQFNDAFSYFMMASRRGHAQSLYYAGYMHLNGIVTAKSCKMAVELFKMAAERTAVAKQLSTARAYYLESDYNAAYYLYSKLAIQGFEIAQSNTGWLLKRNLVSKDLLYASDVNKTVKRLARKCAFKYFEWSAQSNADSQRIVGDYYYYNYLSDNASRSDRNRDSDSDSDGLEEAGIYYQMSAENILGANAQSMFNLGYMHQYGIGKKKDFSMAKRYYDLSAATDPNGNVACYIYLSLLYIERFFEDANNANWTYFIHFVYDNYRHYTNDLNAENAALIVLIIILIIVLWIRR